MSKRKIIRAWKDEEYRQTLSAAEKETMPPNPAGSIELSDAQLRQTTGGTPIYSWTCQTMPCCRRGPLPT
jgi:mersacidin/lichenicidin family type 2 lantibiotic